MNAESIVNADPLSGHLPRNVSSSLAGDSGTWGKEVTCLRVHAFGQPGLHLSIFHLLARPSGGRRAPASVGHGPRRNLEKRASYLHARVCVCV